MKWKLFAVVAALVGGAFWAARRRTLQAAADAELWAEATDPVVRFGDS
jgi:hypothetical protein